MGLSTTLRTAFVNGTALGLGHLIDKRFGPPPGQRKRVYSSRYEQAKDLWKQLTTPLKLSKNTPRQNVVIDAEFSTLQKGAQPKSENKSIYEQMGLPEDYTPHRPAKVVIAVGVSAIFDSQFEGKGLDEFRKHQLDNIENPMERARIHAVVEKLLSLNELDQNERLVEVIILSRNHPDIAMRVDNTLIDPDVGLDIGRKIYTDGEPTWPFLLYLGADIFVSTNEEDVVDAIQHGLPAMHISKNTPLVDPIPKDEAVHLAKDFDGVIADRESDERWVELGAEAYFTYENEHTDLPLNRGPLFQFAKAITDLRNHLISLGYSREEIKEKFVKLSLVTMRGGGGNNKRAKLTLIDPVSGEQLVSFDNMASLGHTDKVPLRKAQYPKGPILRLMGVHLFADDGKKHQESAEENGVAAGHVKWK